MLIICQIAGEAHLLPADYQSTLLTYRNIVVNDCPLTRSYEYFYELVYESKIEMKKLNSFFITQSFLINLLVFAILLMILFAFSAYLL